MIVARANSHSGFKLFILFNKYLKLQTLSNCFHCIYDCFTEKTNVFDSFKPSTGS